MADSQETYYVITANRLVEGDVVYLIDRDGEADWTTDITDADAFPTAERGNAVLLADTSVNANVVVGPYAVEITGTNEPLGTKEKIRSEGPTVPHGKDALPSVNPDYFI